MTQEYTPVTRERPAHLETKSTIDTVITPSPAQVPHSSRTGAAVTDDERSDADIVPGTFAAGNGVQNSDERRGGRERRGSGDGVGRASGGTQRRTGKGTTGAAASGTTTGGSSTSASGKASTGTGPATDPGGQAEKSD